jgi:hypothetical protein
VSTSTPGFIGVIPDIVQIPAPTQSSDVAADLARGYKWVDVTLPPAGEVHFITGWSQYTSLFGDFVGAATAAATAVTTPAVNSGQNNLAHAVYGFLDNGGTSCYVTRVAQEADLGDPTKSPLHNAFARIDDISIVAAPGLVTAGSHGDLMSHCELLLDRVAILDPVQTADYACQKDALKFLTEQRDGKAKQRVEQTVKDEPDNAAWLGDILGLGPVREDSKAAGGAAAGGDKAN